MLRPVWIAIAAAIPMAVASWFLLGCPPVSTMLPAVLPFVVFAVIMYVRRNLPPDARAEVTRLSRHVHGRTIGRNDR